jgi:hypothetical protein
VVSVNQYDTAGRLLELTHTASDDSLIARYEYVLDKVGNQTALTKTVLTSAPATAMTGWATRKA